MKHIVLALTSIMYTTAPAFADKPLVRHFGALKNCYERIYSESHLAEHPQQQVTQIRLTQDARHSGPFGADGKPMIYPDAPDIVVNLWVGLRGEAGMQNATGFCWPEGDGMGCGLECEGGQFSLADRGAGKILLRLKNEIYFHDCDDGDVILDPNPGDKAFLLNRLPDEACQPPG